MCRTVSTSIPNRNLLAQRSEGEAAHESLFAYAVRRKHLAEEFVDLIGGLLDNNRVPLLIELDLSVPVALVPACTASTLRHRLQQRPESYILKVGTTFSARLSKQGNEQLKCWIAFEGVEVSADAFRRLSRSEPAHKVTHIGRRMQAGDKLATLWIVNNCTEDIAQTAAVSSKEHDQKCGLAERQLSALVKRVGPNNRELYQRRRLRPPNLVQRLLGPWQRRCTSRYE